MAGASLPHGSAGIVVTEDRRAVGNSFNAELQLPPTREMYRWMSDITDCMNDLERQNTALAARVDALEVQNADIIQRLVAGGL